MSTLNHVYQDVRNLIKAQGYNELYRIFQEKNVSDEIVEHDNWNGGTHPLHRFLKCEVIQKMGKMIKVNSVGFDFKNKLDTNDLWTGWLPEKSIKILEEI